MESSVDFCRTDIRASFKRTRKTDSGGGGCRRQRPDPRSDCHPLAARARRTTTLNAVPSVQKRGGDAMILTALSVWQALLRAPWATDPDAYLTVDFEGAVIRGSRIALCLYVAEKLFKALRAPESVREVPVPVEAAAVALLLNLGIEYTLCTCPLPDALAHSVGGSPADVATTYLTIVAWRIIYASRSGRM